jgi:hypothetical protein
MGDRVNFILSNDIRENVSDRSIHRSLNELFVGESDDVRLNNIGFIVLDYLFPLTPHQGYTLGTTHGFVVVVAVWRAI